MAKVLRSEKQASYLSKNRKADFRGPFLFKVWGLNWNEILINTRFINLAQKCVEGRVVSSKADSILRHERAQKQ